MNLVNKKYINEYKKYINEYKKTIDLYRFLWYNN